MNYTKEELVAMICDLDKAVTCLEAVRDAMKDGDYNNIYGGFDKFLSQARNYRSDYQTKLGNLVVEGMVKGGTKENGIKESV